MLNLQIYPSKFCYLGFHKFRPLTSRRRHSLVVGIALHQPSFLSIATAVQTSPSSAFVIRLTTIAQVKRVHRAISCWNPKFLMFLFNIYNHTILLYSFCLKDHAENSIGVTADDVRVSIAASDAHGETNNELLELMRKLVEYTVESASRALRVLERLFDYLLRSGSWKRRSPCSASRSWIWRFYSSLVSAFFLIQGLITV